MFGKIGQIFFRKLKSVDDLVLNIKINNNKPVDINDLAKSLNGVSVLYKEFIDTHDYIFEVEPKLYVKTIQEGSIDIYLVAQLATSLEFVNSMVEFYKHVSDIVDIFINNKPTTDKLISKKERLAAHDFVGVTARDIDASVDISLKDNYGVVINNSQVHINVTEANSMQNNIKRQIEELATPLQRFYEQVEMYWADANFLSNKKHGQAIIENIDNKAIGVKFAHDDDRKKCMANNVNYPDTPWQDLLYTIDVEAIYVQGKLKAYRILKVYDDVLPLSD